MPSDLVRLSFASCYRSYPCSHLFCCLFFFVFYVAFCFWFVFVVFVLFVVSLFLFFVVVLAYWWLRSYLLIK